MSVTADQPTLIGNDPYAPNLAVDVQPDQLDNTFVVGVSEVGSFDLLGWSADSEGAWVNVVCDVTEVQFNRGARSIAGLLTMTEAGEATVTLTDTLHRFDPLTNADAIHTGTPLRVRAWGYDPDGERWDAVLFRGELDEIPVTYRRDLAPSVTLTVVDIIAPLAAWEAEGRDEPGVGTGDTLLQRVQRVINETGIAITISPDSDTAYEATLAPTVLATGWDVIEDAVMAEQGRVWVNLAGQLVVRSRGSLLTGPVRGTLSDVHGELAGGDVHACYAAASPRLSTDTLTNRVIASRRVPRDPELPDALPSAIVRVDDEYSQARYRVRAKSSTLDLETDDQLIPWAQELLLAEATPNVRVDTVEPAPWGTSDAAPNAWHAWEAVCKTDLGDRWAFLYHPLGAPPIVRTQGVLGISMSIDPGGWSVTWRLTDAPTPGDTNPSGWFAVDVSTVGGDDVLAPFGGPVTPTT